MIPTNFEVVVEATPVSVNEITNTIENVREAFCRRAGNADIRIWFSADASGKILGVGAGAQSGLEVTFHCK